MALKKLGTKKMENKIFCSNCGKENSIDSYFCIHCGQMLRNKKNFNEGKKFNSLESILSQENKKTLENTNLSTDIYKTILNNVLEMGKSNYGDEIAITPLEKILKIASSYTSCSYKSKGEELGYYAFNVIFVDDRLDDSQQIATLIHELSHHLLAEIYENILMFLWQVKKSPILESFVWLSTVNLENITIANEYCAHTVEGRFIPHGYQNYGSFNKLVKDSDLSDDLIGISLILGNTIANDIINILEEFIDKDLREEIKIQFKKDLIEPRYDQIIMEQEDVLNDSDKNKFIINSLIVAFDFAVNNQEIKNQIKDYEKIFKELNK